MTYFSPSVSDTEKFSACCVLSGRVAQANCMRTLVEAPLAGLRRKAKKYSPGAAWLALLSSVTPGAAARDQRRLVADLIRRGFDRPVVRAPGPSTCGELRRIGRGIGRAEACRWRTNRQESRLKGSGGERHVPHGEMACGVGGGGRSLLRPRNRFGNVDVTPGGIGVFGGVILDVDCGLRIAEWGIANVG